MVYVYFYCVYKPHKYCSPVHSLVRLTDSTSILQQSEKKAFSFPDYFSIFSPVRPVRCADEGNAENHSIMYRNEDRSTHSPDNLKSSSWENFTLLLLIRPIGIFSNLWQIYWRSAIIFYFVFILETFNYNQNFFIFIKLLFVRKKYFHANF